MSISSLFDFLVSIPCVFFLGITSYVEHRMEKIPIIVMIFTFFKAMFNFGNIVMIYKTRKTRKERDILSYTWDVIMFIFHIIHSLGIAILYITGKDPYLIFNYLKPIIEYI